MPAPSFSHRTAMLGLTKYPTHSALKTKVICWLGNILVAVYRIFDGSRPVSDARDGKI